MTTPAIDNINLLRKRILDGEDPSVEEMHEAIKQLRGEREVASAKSPTTKKARKPKPELNLAELFAKKD